MDNNIQLPEDSGYVFNLEIVPVDCNITVKDFNSCPLQAQAIILSAFAVAISRKVVNCVLDFIKKYDE